MVKMKKLIPFILFFIFVFCLGAVIAAQDKEIPPWMEDIQSDAKSTYLVPKGARREIIGSQIIVEAPNEYVARRLYEMEGYLEKRFRKIEKNQEDLREELKEVREIVEDLKDDSRTVEKFIEMTETMEELERQIEAMEILEEPEESAEETDGLIGVVEELEELTDMTEDQKE